RHVHPVLHPGAFRNHGALHRPRGVDAELTLGTLLCGRVRRVHGHQREHRAREDSEPHPSAHDVLLPHGYDVSNCHRSSPELGRMLETRVSAVKGFLGPRPALSCGAALEGRMPKPRVIYEPKPGSPIAVDRAFYDRLAGETG